MTNVRIVALAAFALAALPNARAWAQAWVQPPGGYYFKLTGSFLTTNDQYDAVGDLEPLAAGDSLLTEESFRDITINAYLEYGLSERYTLVASLPFKISTTEDTQAPLVPGDAPRSIALTNGGLADLWVSLRTPVVRRATAVSIQAGVKIPLGYEQVPDNGGPALGTGEIDAEADIAIGRGFWPVPVYASAGIGYRYRGGANYDDEVFYDIEAGFTTKKLFAKIRFDGLQNLGPIGSPTSSLPAGTASADANARNQDRFWLTPVVAYHLRGSLAVTAEAYCAIAGKNTIAGTTWVLGVIWTN